MTTYVIVASGSIRHMPRKLRVEYEGAIYHLMNRGDRREYLKSPGKRPSWLRADRLMGEWGVKADTAAG